MQGPEARRQLAERYFTTLVEACFPLMEGPDQEVALEALLDAAEMLKERLEQELAELRQEQAD